MLRESRLDSTDQPYPDPPQIKGMDLGREKFAIVDEPIRQDRRGLRRIAMWK